MKARRVVFPVAAIVAVVSGGIAIFGQAGNSVLEVAHQLTAPTQFASFLGGAPHGDLPGVPTQMLTIYQSDAAHNQCPGLSWTVLAAIGHVESSDNTNPAVSPAGAEGPMQFEPSTWKIYGVDGNGDGVADINDPADAVPSAARYLCAMGGGDPATLRQAIFGYNHADWYVNKVTSLATHYDNLVASQVSDLASGDVVSDVGFAWPIAARQGVIESCWNEVRSYEHHPGMDIAAPTGTPVYAAGDGTVEFAGDRNSGYGIEIVIKHENGLWTLYGHLSEVLVTPGQTVKRSQLIGRVGSTGHATGPHLHFNVDSVSGDGATVGTGSLNPLNFLPMDGRKLTAHDGIGTCGPGLTGYAS